jgi:hypothetical protein
MFINTWEQRRGDPVAARTQFLIPDHPWWLHSKIIGWLFCFQTHQEHVPG